MTDSHIRHLFENKVAGWFICDHNGNPINGPWDSKKEAEDASNPGASEFVQHMTHEPVNDWK